MKNISNQHKEQIQLLRKSGVIDVETKYLGEKFGPNGTKTLMEAAMLDDYRGVEFLLRNGVNPISQDFNGFDVLYYAVINSSLSVI